ncbi:MAG TPA: solute carrier family 23 protein [Mycobacteriales bacterium]|nr:solute carrier family 23 protein [Mycobacteriales bacterium]
MGIWALHGDGGRLRPDEVVRPEERLSWPATVGIGGQHVLAMFGATFLVPVLTGFPPATTIFFSGVGTVLFLLITGNRLPSYLGSSFAFIAPVIAAQTEGGIPAALGGIVVAGVLLALVGALVHVVGVGPVDWLLPPVVTGTIVALIGLNLAPVAFDSYATDPLVATVVLAVVLVVTVASRGLLGRLSIVVGVLVGYALAAARGDVDWSGVRDAAWVGFPELTAPSFTLRASLLVLPVVLVLVAENVGHVKAVAAMTGTSFDRSMGRALVGDGVATAVAGSFGGSGTTTYAENIGVMAASRVYSTAPYWVAAFVAMALGLCPKFGAAVAAIPGGVLGGATTVLYGLIAVLGARIWVESKVDFRDPVNLLTASVALIIGAANYRFTQGDVTLEGIALGSLAAVVVYRVLRLLQARGLGPLGDSPSDLPSADLTR